MRLPFNNHVFHTTYCLNIHAGETWAENLESIRVDALRVRDRVCADAPFGLGLRVGNVAAVELERPQRLRQFKEFLSRESLYVFTINGFPYGRFHGIPVKEDVYLPDWSMPERVEYTLKLARILAELLPESVTGSISTVPVGYRRDFIETPGRLHTACQNLATVAEALSKIEAESGRRIVLALEPEPDCVCDCSEDVLTLFSQSLNPMLDNVSLPFLGICLDLCHSAVLFEDPKAQIAKFAKSGIPVAKIQVSAAPKCRVTPESLSAMRDFVDPVYLHQTAVRDGSGVVHRFPDLPPALEFCELRKLAESADCELRTHFHVPLFCGEFVGGIGSTADGIDADMFAVIADAGGEQLEIETYSFGVLKPEFRPADVVDSVVGEFDWLKQRMEVIRR